MSIVTVSHEIGAGGPEIGQKVAERLRKAAAEVRAQGPVSTAGTRPGTP